MSLEKSAQRLEEKGRRWTAEQWQGWRLAKQGLRRAIGDMRLAFRSVPLDAWPELWDIGTEAMGLKMLRRTWTAMVGQLLKGSPGVIGGDGDDTQLRALAADFDDKKAA